MSCLSEGLDYVFISPTCLAASEFIDKVADESSGAISSFIGVTRNNFQGKDVMYLSYEAYEPMALKKMMDICRVIRDRWSVTKIAIGHRTGVVAVKEPSVVIAISSAHRRESLEAVQFAIDELKATVPIWKKEFFADGSVWKENSESRSLFQLSPSALPSS